MDITNLNIEQLEALGYRTRKKLDLDERNLQLIEARLEELLLQEQMEIAKNGDPKDVMVPPTGEPEQPKTSEPAKAAEKPEKEADKAGTESNTTE